VEDGGVVRVDMKALRIVEDETVVGNGDNNVERVILLSVNLMSIDMIWRLTT
jgi:hypothetical protein